MLTIQAASLIAFFATTTLVSAHGHVTEWTINGQKKPGFNPSWRSQFGSTAERPTDNADQGFVDYTTAAVACGGWSTGDNVETWDLDAGSTVTARWNNWDYGHKGPVTEYMARCPGSSCDGVPGDSLDWFKISEATYADGRWPTERISTGLEWSFQIPGDLAPGPYLVRHNLMSMHDPTHPQLYPVCFQANLKGSGNAYPGNTARFPGAYNINDKFKSLNIYYGDDLYAFVPPGPSVYSGGGGGAAPAPASEPAPASAPSPSPAPAPAYVADPSPSPAKSEEPAYVAPSAVFVESAPAATSAAAAVTSPGGKTCRMRVKRALVARSAVPDRRAVIERHAKRSRRGSW